MEADVCETYVGDRDCWVEDDTLDVTLEMLRTGIREQECYSCPFPTSPFPGGMNYPPWGFAPRRVRELCEATGLNITFGVIDMDLARDWTPATFAAYLLWLLPAFLSALALPLMLLMRHFLQLHPRVRELRDALSTVELDDLSARWQPAWSRPAARVRLLARLASALAVCLFPWLPAFLILTWVLPIARSTSIPAKWMLDEELGRLRRLIPVSAITCMAYGLWIVFSVTSGFPSLPLLWSMRDTDGDNVDGESVRDIVRDCPVILGKTTSSCFSLLVGLELASVFFAQGVLCLLTAAVLVAFWLAAPGPVRLVNDRLHWLSASSLQARIARRTEAEADRPARFGRGELIAGQPKEAATGIYGFIGYSEDELRRRMTRGIEAIVEEVGAFNDDVLSECLQYVLHERAGSSERTFQNGWMRDRAPDGTRLAGRDGMRLADFCKLPVAQTAQLSDAHVAALRLYTTAAFQAINKPMRDLRTRPARAGEEDMAGKGVPLEPPKLARPHPLPITVAFIYEGLKRMRAASAIQVDSLDEASTAADIDELVTSTERTVAAVAAINAASARREASAAVKVTEAGDNTASAVKAAMPFSQGPEGVAAAAAPKETDVEYDDDRSQHIPASIRSEDVPVGGGSTCNGAHARWAPTVATPASVVIEVGASTSAGEATPREEDVADGRRCARDASLAQGRRASDKIAPEQFGLLRRLPSTFQASLRRSSQSAGPDIILWRGMRDLHATNSFLVRGGTELAPMSTTTNINIAARYARAGRDNHSLVFRLRSSTFMNLGCDLMAFSAFPHEKEALYPPLTYLQPTGKPHQLVYDGCTYTILDVEPSFPS